MATKGGVGAGGSGGDEAWARVGNVNGKNGNGNGNGNGNENGNEVSIPVPVPMLMALCEEAGWTIEADGTIYRKGPKPRTSKSEVLLPPWATSAGASGFSFQTSTPPLMSIVTSGRTPGPDPVTLMTDFQISTGAAANMAPAYSSFVATGASSLSAGSSPSASAWMLPLLPRQSSRRGGALLSPLRFSEQASAREDADEEEGLEPNLGNAETRKNCA